MAAKKKPKKDDAMLGALAASFGTSKPVLPAAEPIPEPVTIEEGRGADEEPAPAPPPPVPASEPPPVVKKPAAKKKELPPIPENLGVKKTTVSFHPAEQDKIDQILDALLRGRRHRGGFSDAVKIAIRLCPIDLAEIAEAWDQARTQDLRVSRHRKDS